MNEENLISTIENFIDNGEIDQAEHFIAKYLEDDDVSSEPDLFFMLHMYLAEIFRRKSRFEKAKKILHKIMLSKNQISNKFIISGTLNELSHIERLQGNLNKAIECRKRHIDFAREIGDDYEIAVGYGEMGLLYLTIGNFPEAKTRLEKAIELDKKMIRSSIKLRDSESSYACHLGYLANIHLHLGEYDNAIDTFNHVIKINESLGNKWLLADNYQNMGNLCQEIEKWDDAIKYYEKALKLAKKQNYRNCELSVYIGLSGVYFKSQKDLTKAIKYTQMVIKVGKVLGSKHQVALAYKNMGIFYENQKEYSKAIDNLLLSKELLVVSEDFQYLLEIFYDLGRIYLKLEDIKNAEFYFQKGLNLSKDIDSKEWIDNFLKILKIILSI